MLDTLRGVLIIGVVLSHFLFYMGESGFLWAEWLFVNPIIDGISLFGRILFVVLAGLCSRLSRSNLKRGLMVLAAAAVISTGTLIFDLVFFGEIGNVFIYMGILHLLAVCMLSYAGLERLFFKARPLPDAAAIALSVFFLALFIITYNISRGIIGIGALSIRFEPTHTFAGSIIGTGTYSIVSADDFPLLPWIFAFFSGAFLGKFFKEDKVPAFLQKDVCPPVTYIGKKTLWIYIIHAPLVYGIAVLIRYIVG